MMNFDTGYLVGITGNSGCGQSTAAGFITEQCAGVCSLDRIAHRLLSKAYVLRDLADGFSRSSFLTMNENEIRSELRSIVFDDPDKMLILNSILHPRMIRWASTSAASLKGSRGMRVLEGALIFELGIDRYLDYTIVIEDTPERSAERLAERDDISTEYALKRWKRQLPINAKANRADYVVHNSQGLGYMKQQILNIFEELESRLLI
ncbi:MAG: dephospho-CoA kinase [Candidatus Aegiribacteria sp.]|nr:dephospho-CoA kinase [Candidatus Aegiribacteria sp.]